MILLWACASPEPPPEQRFVELDPPRLLRRMSLDLRGVLPSEAELAAVEADPAELDRLRDEMLEDARLEERLVSFWTEHLRTRLDEFQVRYYDYGLPPSRECEFERAIGEEPARIFAHVAVEDRPWGEAVTADYTMANELLAGIWPLDYPAGASGWQEARWTDGRPAVGVVVSNGFLWRYVTSQSNANRSRVTAISNLLLCVDLLSRPVSFGDTPSLTDAEGTANALKTEDACLACHATVEPIAATLFGFYPAVDYNGLELGVYHPERAPMGPEKLDVEPAWYGQPIDGLADLGPAIASDSRYYMCGAETVATLFWRRPTEVADFDTVAALRDDFGDAGWTLRPLIRAVTETPQYRAGGLGALASDEDAERERTARLMSADQLQSAIEDLTGFSWEYNDCGQLANDDYGYRVLVGGVDGDQVTAPQQDAGLTWALVGKRLAQAAATHVVEAEVERGESQALFSVGPEVGPADEAFREQVRVLYRRLFAREPSDVEQAEEAALFAAAPDAVTGWILVLSSLLRDPEFLTT